MRRIGGATHGRAARLLAVLATVGAALAVPAVATASGPDNSGRKSVDLKVRKYAVPAVVASGATSITWKIVVTNKGGRDLTDVKVEDTGVKLGTPVSAIDCKSGDDSSGSSEDTSSSGGKDRSSYKSSNSSDDDHSSCADKPDVLQPGETWTYTATQAIDPKTCGTVTNTVKVTATAPKYSDDEGDDDKDKADKKKDDHTSSTGNTSTYKKSDSTSSSPGGKDGDDDGDHHVVGTQTVTATATGRAFVSCPAIAVTKSAEKSSYAKGETITWIVTVKNTGNVPLSSPVITDDGVTFGPPTSDRGGVLVAKRSTRLKTSYSKWSMSSGDHASCGSTSTYSSKSSSDDDSSCPPPATCDSSAKTAKSTSSDDGSCDAPKPCPEASKSSTSSDDASCEAPKPCPEASKSSTSRSSSDDHCEAPKPPETCTQSTSKTYKHQTSDDHACPPPAGGAFAPGETLTYRGTQTASVCGTVTNTVKVDATALPPTKEKKHRKDKKHRGEYTASTGVKHDSSYRRTSSYGAYNPTTPPTSTTVSGTAKAKTFVVCDVTVSKTASLSYTKTFGWTVVKTPAVGGKGPITVTVPATDTAATVAVGYVVTVTKDAGTDSNIAVTGKITVNNPYPDPLSVTLADDVRGVTGESCTLTPSATVTVPGKGSSVVDYSCGSLPSVPAPDSLNQATATFTVNGRSDTATGTVAVGAGTVTPVNDRVVVKDALSSPVLASSDVRTLGAEIRATTTFSGPTTARNLPVPAAGQPCSVFTNVATAEASSLQPKSTSLPVSSAPVVVTVCKETTAPSPQPPGNVPDLGTPSPPGSGGTVGGAGTTPKTPRPRLVVTKKGPAAAVAGQLVRYTITVRNAGKVTARGVRLSDVLPGGFTVGKKVKGASVSGGAVRWSVGTLASGRSTTVRVTLRLSRTISGRRCNVATATASNASTARGRQCTRIAAIAGALDPAVTG